MEQKQVSWEVTLVDVLAQCLSVLKCLCREGLRYRSDFSFWSSTLTLHSRKGCNLQWRSGFHSLQGSSWGGSSAQGLQSCQCQQGNKSLGPSMATHTGEGLEVPLRNRYKKCPSFSLSLLKPLESYQPQKQQKQKKTWKHPRCWCGAHTPAPLSWTLSSGAWKYS